MSYRLDRGAWLTLATAVLLLVWGAAGTLYFFSLPTDGWLAMDPPVSDPVGLIYTQNGAGASSELQPGDRVIAIDGITPNQGDLGVLSSRWQAGNTFHYLIVRDGTTLTVPVSLVRWSFIPAVQVFVKLNGGIGGLLGLFIFLVIAAFTFFKRPADHAAHALLLLAALAFFASIMINIFISNPASLIFPEGEWISYLPIVAVFTVAYPPSLIRLSLVFPHPKPVVQRHPTLEFVPYLIGLAVVPAFFLTNGTAGYLWSITSVVITIAILFHNTLTMKDALSRAQLFWGVWGIIVSLFLLLLDLLITDLYDGATAAILNTLSKFSFGMLGITLSIAILRYRLFEISFIIRRTLQYVVLTIVLALIYFGGVLLLQQTFRALTGQESDLAVVLSTLGIAALFNSLRRRVQELVDRRFYRQKFDTALALEELSTAARSEVGLDKLTGRMVAVVKESLQPEFVILWLKKDKG